MKAMKSAYLRSKLVKHIANQSTYSPPSGLYLAIYSSDPTVSDTGTEAAGGSYARQQLSFAAESGGSIQSNTSESFTMPAGTWTHWGIRDASSGGNLLYFGAFDIAITTSAGGTIPINSGDISITEA